MIKAAVIENLIRKGSSVPIVASDKRGENFFVKAKAAGDGLTSLISDWIVTSIGTEIGLPVLKPMTILIDDSVQFKYKHVEVYNIVKRSYGANLAYNYFPAAEAYDPENPEAGFDANIKDLIFLFDSFFLNIDRTKNNPNIFISGKEIYAVDFGACFLIKEIFDDIPYCRNVEIQKLLKRNIFYNENAEAELLLQKLSSLSFKKVSDIIYGFPDEWLEGSRVSKIDLAEKLFNYINKDNHLKKALTVLKEIEIPSDEELIKKQRENKKKFEEQVFKNVVPLMPESKRFSDDRK